MDKIARMEEIALLEAGPADLIGASGSVAVSQSVELPPQTAVYYKSQTVGTIFGGVPVESEPEVYFL